MSLQSKISESQILIKRKLRDYNIDIAGIETKVIQLHVEENTYGDEDLTIIADSEIIIILGIASLIEWNIDLPGIAGILATVGTGIDQQIIILDEARQSLSLSIKQRMKRAFTIILGAYFTAVVALLPLLWAGAGLLKGFAVTTIIGITAGVLITRPAFADMIRRIEKD